MNVFEKLPSSALLATSVNAALSERTIEHFMSDIATNNRVQKQWHMYITEFLILHLKNILNNDHNRLNLPNVHWKQMRLSSYLCYHSNLDDLFYFDAFWMQQDKMAHQQNLLKQMCSTGDEMKEHLVDSSICFTETNLRKASGKFEGTDGLSWSKKRICHNFLWTFNLDPQLWLNITVMKLYFKSKFDDCILEQLKIQNTLHNTRYDGELWLSLSNKRPANLKYILKENAFIFCGQHSIFSLYPSFHHIDIRVILIYYIQFDLRVEYSVVDFQNFIHSLTFSHQVPKPYIVHIIQNYSVMSYCIKVRKVDHIVLNITGKKFVIYDGPGFLSPVLEPNQNNILRASSFECVLQILSKINVLYQVQFSSNHTFTAPMVLKSNQSDIIMALPNTEFFLPLNIVPLQAEAGSQINATVLSMSYFGMKSITCKYSGFLAAEYFPYSYQESVALCQYDYGSSVPHKSFFSSNSSLMLVLYSFEHYSSIITTVVISRTKCKGTHVDLCTYTMLCQATYSTQKVHFSECLLFLQSAVHTLPRFQLSPVGRSFMPPVQFSLPIDQCYIIQLTLNNTLEEKARILQQDWPTCSIHLVPEPISVPNVSIKFSISVSLGYHRRHDPNRVDLSGLADNLCVQIQKDEQAKCWKRANYPDHLLLRVTSNRFSSSAAEYFHYGDIFSPISGEILSPLDTRSLLLDVEFPIHSCSWMDIVLVKTITKKIELKMMSHLASAIPLSDKKYDLSKLISRSADFMFSAKQNFHISVAVCASFLFPSGIYTSQVTLSAEQADSTVSLPGEFWTLAVKVASTFNANLFKQTLRVFELYDSYLPYSPLQNYHIGLFFNPKMTDNCKVKGFHTYRIYISSEPMCRIITNLSKLLGDVNSRKMFLLFNKPRLYNNCSYPTKYQQYFPVSWRTAAKKCKQFGGHLPSFTSREDLRKVMAIMKFFDRAECLEGIFIGLSIINIGQVRKVIVYCFPLVITIPNCICSLSASIQVLSPAFCVHHFSKIIFTFDVIKRVHNMGL